jgi:hypothetical protein
VELAAAWVRTISPPEIAREIKTNLSFLTTNQRDVPERHRSLRRVRHAWQRLTETRTGAVSAAFHLLGLPARGG